MDSETIEMLNWVNAELATYTDTLEQVQAHIVELELLRAELLGAETNAATH